MTDPLAHLQRNGYGAILADPPWSFRTWSENGKDRSAEQHYDTMDIDEIVSLQVEALAADDCVLFLWACWPSLQDALRVIEAWGFTYKTCAFAWLKADGKQMDLFRDNLDAHVGMGYWTRSNSEPCLLATRGHPKRIHADVRQGIIEPRRQHSRKPDCVHARIERLVAGPYLELFARERRAGWDCFGDEVDMFSDDYDAADDLSGSIGEAFRVINERKASGGSGWEPK